MKYHIVMCVLLINLICNTPNVVECRRFKSAKEKEFYISDSSKSTECLNRECTLATYRIGSNMDRNTSPCTDFYKFTCGKYILEERIPREANMISVANEMVNNDQKEIRKFLEDVDEDDPQPYQYLKRFYDSCINLDYKHQDEIIKIYHQFISRTGWPVLMDSETIMQWNDDPFDWISIINVMYKAGLPAEYFYKLSIETDPARLNEYILAIDQPTLEFSKEAFEQYPDMLYEMKQYHSYMVDVALIFDADEETAKSQFSKTLEFEYQLSKIIVPNDQVFSIYDRRSRYSLVELMTLTPKIDWSHIINSHLGDNTFIDYDEIVIVKAPQYLVELSKLIEKTEYETLANYLIWKMLSESAQFINDELRLRTYEYRNTFKGPVSQKPIWSECVDVIKQYYPGMINAFFADNEKSEILTEATNEIVNEIKTSFAETLETSSITNNELKNTLMSKVQSLSYNVGFSSLDNDYAKSLEYYNVSPCSDNYFQSVLLISKRHRQFYIQRYKQGTPLQDAWIKRINTPLYDVSYDPKYNSISMGIGNLNSLYIHTNLPYYVRFAGIGILLGRLVTQIYDEFGKYFDADGTLWDLCQLACDEQFINETQCIITQYKNFLQRLNWLKLGNVTQHQNLADFHGVQIAYKAYVKWLTDHGGEEKLPGLSYTNKQMFWIWYGNTQCTKYTPFAYSRLIETGDDVDSKFRVNGPLVNSQYFTNDFNCNHIDYMVISKKCKIII